MSFISKVLIVFIMGLSCGLLYFGMQPNDTSEAAPIRPLDISGIVRIMNKENGRFFCTGFVVDDVHVITAGHCTEPFMATVDTLLISDSEGHFETATAIGSNERSDQGMIRGDFKFFKKRQISIKPIHIEMVFHNRPLKICGFPYGGKLACSSFTFQQHEIFQMAGHAFVYPGMSGGPVIDETTGVIVGLITASEGSWAILSPLTEIWSALGLEAQ